MGFKPAIILFFRNIFAPNSLRTMEWRMLKLLNRDRRDFGLKPLFMQEDLRHVARKHSKDMAKLDYFEHENFRGQTHVDRYKQENISDVVSGENLAKIGGYSHPVHRAERGLMNSPGHRANILNPLFNCVGIGAHRSKTKVNYYTQNFAHRDLIFTRKVPRAVNIKKGVTLRFKPVRSGLNGVYRVQDGSTVIAEKGFGIVKGVNMLHIPFQSTGIYQIDMFTGERGNRKLKLSNRINVLVRRGLFS